MVITIQFHGLSNDHIKHLSIAAFKEPLLLLSYAGPLRMRVSSLKLFCTYWYIHYIQSGGC